MIFLPKKEKKKKEKEDTFTKSFISIAAAAVFVSIIVILIYYTVIYQAGTDVSSYLNTITTLITQNPLWILGVALFAMALVSAIFMSDYPIIFIALIIAALVVILLAWFYSNISLGSGTVTEGSGNVIPPNDPNYTNLRTEIINKFKEIYAKEGEVYILGSSTLNYLIDYVGIQRSFGKDDHLIGYSRVSEGMTIREGRVVYTTTEMANLVKSKLYPFYIEVGNKTYTVLAYTTYYHLTTNFAWSIIDKKSDLTVGECTNNNPVYDLSKNYAHIPINIADCILGNVYYTML